MPTAEEIVRAILTTFAGPFYVAGTDTQRNRIIKEATRQLTPLLQQSEKTDK